MTYLSYLVAFGAAISGASAGGGGGGGGGFGGPPGGGASFVALTDFSSGGSPLLGYQSYGGGGIGAYGGGGGLGGGIGGGIGGYGVGGLGGIGAYDASRYAALAVESSSSASTIGAYNTYAQGFGVGRNIGGGKHGGGIGGLALPRLPNIGGGGKHGGKHQAAFIPQPETVEVQQFVDNEGALLENEVNAYRRKKSYTVTHKPVYHKTVYNQYTAHDTVAKDVYHHMYEDETRHYDVDGEEFHAGALNVNHGKVGHGSYQSLVASSSSGSGAYVAGGYQGGAIGGAIGGGGAYTTSGFQGGAIGGGLQSPQLPNIGQGGGYPVVEPPQGLQGPPGAGGFLGAAAAGGAGYSGSVGTGGGVGYGSVGGGNAGYAGGSVGGAGYGGGYP